LYVPLRQLPLLPPSSSLSGFGPLRALPSFPTRRSSDLQSRVRLDAISWLPTPRSKQRAGFRLHRLRFLADEAKSIQRQFRQPEIDRKSTRLNSSHLVTSYAVFCLKKKIKLHHTTEPVLT